MSDQANALMGQMLDAILRFERDELRVDELSSVLKSQVAALADLIDRDAVEKIREMRNDIEVVNATFLNSGRKTPTRAERDEAQKAIAELKAALDDMKTLDDDVQPGTRVKVVKDSRWNGPWPTEPTGVIDSAADVPVRVIDLATMPEVNVPDSDRGPMREFLVRFDEPQYDGDGAGPYFAAVIWEKYLRPID